MNDEIIKNNDELYSIIPIRDIVIYPNITVYLFIGRKQSINSLEYSIKNNKNIILLTQKDPLVEEPKNIDLFNIGTLSKILQIFKISENIIKILVEGLETVYIENLYNNKIFIESKIKILKNYIESKNEIDILIKILIDEFNKYIKFDKKISFEIINSIHESKEPLKIVYIISYNISIDIKKKQKILEELNINKKIEIVIKIIKSKIEIFEIEKNIRFRIKKQIEKSQKEYYLNEQLKAIKKELEKITNTKDEYEYLKNKILKKKIKIDIKEKLLNELNKFKYVSSSSAESFVIRNYIDTILSLPWNKSTLINKDIKNVENCLNKFHYGLYEVKERILEYLSVQNRNKLNIGTTLCLVGPPGVGKTSLVKSIATSINRNYEKISLGGLKDEAEIRGHRRTYIGSMPGKIIQKIIKSKVNNPLILLDEIDKISLDNRNDPSSALLEVLDKEQNKNFNDNYIELDFDLSKIMFIATANSIYNIPYTLLDRMEIINISGYTEKEKLYILKNYMLKKQIKNNFLLNKEIKIKNFTLLNIIRNYTRESGLRNLERLISKICRKVVKILSLNNKKKSININNINLKKFLGPIKYEYNDICKDNKIGKIIGLAWTEYGGDSIIIESTYVKGNGKLIFTGNLGKIMQESIKTSLTLVKSKSKTFLINEEIYNKIDIHIHVPEASIPKDGPSAGITICTSLISLLSNRKIKNNFAMTGEITILGDVLAIGGLKEKILAAKRIGVKNIIIPKKNLKDLYNLNKDIKNNIKIYTVNYIEEVIKYSLI